jgi:hypothetical protein
MAAFHAAQRLPTLGFDPDPASMTMSDNQLRDATLLEPLNAGAKRSDRVPVPLHDRVIAAEQQTADRYHRAGVLAKPVDVRSGFDRSFA